MNSNVKQNIDLCKHLLKRKPDDFCNYNHTTGKNMCATCLFDYYCGENNMIRAERYKKAKEFLKKFDDIKIDFL